MIGRFPEGLKFTVKHFVRKLNYVVSILNRVRAKGRA